MKEIKNYFEVEETGIEENHFVLIGRIIQGLVKAGMKIQLNLNNSIVLTEAVHRVDQKGKEIKLYIECESEDEKEMWRQLNISQEKIEIIDP